MITCDKCAYCSPTPGGSLYCALTDHFVPNIGCEHGEPINKPQTNADRIRSMTDEELASVLLDERCSFCDANNYSVCNSTKRCHEEIEAWLKAEVKDG